MKLLTTGGLLYGANAVGSWSGTYQTLDYVAMFPEGTNTSTTTTTMDVGWSPVVTAVVTCGDGAKAMTGFGKTTGTVLKGWIVKMWSATGTNKCNDTIANANTITGYVQMVPSVAVAHSGTTSCTLTALAYVQYFWSEQLTGGEAGSTLINSVFVALSMDSTGGTSYTDAYLVAAGGLGEYNNYGLGDFKSYLKAIDKDGANQAFTNYDAANHNNYRHTFPLGIAYTGTAVDAKAAIGSAITNSCFTVVGQFLSNATFNNWTAGSVFSNQTCVEFASDGYTLTGFTVFYRFARDLQLVPSGTQGTIRPGDPTDQPQFADIAAVAPFTGTPNASQAGVHLGAVVQVTTEVSDQASVAAGTQAMFLQTAPAGYASSVVLTLLGNVAGNNLSAVGAKFQIEELAKATYYQVRAFYTYKAAETGTAQLLFGEKTDAVIFCGQNAQVGHCFKFTLNALQATAVVSDLNAVMTDFTGTGVASNIKSFTGPIGGLGQFRGLAQGTTEDKYVQVICKGIAPMYMATYSQNLASGTDNGFIIQCYTGAAQCVVNVSNMWSPLTDAEIASCQNDPRYMTWRALTLKIDYTGNTDWYRTDSYWNSAATEFGSTMGTNITLSTSNVQKYDNFVASSGTAFGKTFVFAYSDGSGVQFNHLSYGYAYPSTNTTSGTTGNTLVTAPTSYTNSKPARVSDNLCLSSYLELTGTTDTSGLASTITAFSDGYKGKFTLALDQILPGAAGGWSGICVVLYSSQYVQDNTNGALCHLAAQSTATGASPHDYAASTLNLVPSTTWQPPAMSASVTTSSGSLTDAKYGLVLSPTTSATGIYNDGYFVTATFYQPKYGSSYTDTARYGKDNYVGVYCARGSGSTTYFSAPATPTVKLTGAISLAVGLFAIGSAVAITI